MGTFLSWKIVMEVRAWFWNSRAADLGIAVLCQPEDEVHSWRIAHSIKGKLRQNPNPIYLTPDLLLGRNYIPLQLNCFMLSTECGQAILSGKHFQTVPHRVAEGLLCNGNLVFPQQVLQRLLLVVRINLCSAFSLPFVDTPCSTISPWR